MMKKFIYLFATAMAIALAGCSDDEIIEGQGIPVETGDEIRFGSTLNGDQNAVGEPRTERTTRTIYGERTKTGIPVYWDRTDTVAIFCPQASAPATKLVNYYIEPDVNAPNTSSLIIKTDKDVAGLQWGAEDIHKFYGIYPSSIVKGAAEENQTRTIRAYLPELQQPIRWRRDDKVWRGEPNMDFAAMYAYTTKKKSEISKDKAINLEFKNLVTVLDITIPGPKSGEVTVTNVNVEVERGENPAICGNFTIHIEDADNPGNGVICEATDYSTINNIISIPCYDPKTNEFITLGTNDSINVKAFIIPDNKDAQFYRKFKITVATLNGSAKSINLTKPEGSNVQAIVPHKINRILLPPIEDGTPVAWMSRLDNRIYLTELSIPGSKMSYLTADNQANPAFQTKTIEQQFDAGVRAFIVQTGAETTYTETKPGFISPYKYTFKSCNMPVWGAATGTKLENTLDAITQSLNKGEKKTECAFLVLTCHSSLVKNLYYYNGQSHDKPRGGGQPVNWAKDWILTVEKRLNELAKTYPIYTKEITANTTLGDVRGKIIVKVNYNDESQESYLAKDATVPALFGIWKKPEETNLAPHSELYWGTLNPQTNRTNMWWLCQEATNVGNNAEITVNNKKAAITEMFRKNIQAYKTREQHDLWFMNDIGGVYTDNNSTTKLALEMNMIAVQHLQTRKENAATGLVFMNFADRDQESGAKYRSDYIIATIIDNNFKFALRKEGTNMRR